MKKPGILESPFPGGLLLHDPQRGKTLVLNETAALVWRLADSEPREIAKALAGQFEVSEGEALADVLKTLKLLQEEGFLV